AESRSWFRYGEARRFAKRHRADGRCRRGRSQEFHGATDSRCHKRGAHHNSRPTIDRPSTTRRTGCASGEGSGETKTCRAATSLPERRRSRETRRQPGARGGIVATRGRNQHRSESETRNQGSTSPTLIYG